MQENLSLVPPGFCWQRTDNSFSFNFLPDTAPSTPQSAMEAEQIHPAQPDDSETSSGFIFNFQIPTQIGDTGPKPRAEQTQNNGAATGTETQNSELSAESKSKIKKKKKKKKAGAAGVGKEDEPEKQVKNKMEEAPKQEKIELTAEEQLNRELDWCIEQLELGLRTQKSSVKQREEASRALKTLRSSKAPIVKKRQVMRAVSGDYRRKMEEDRDRQLKLIRSATTTAQITTVSQPSRKPVFHRRAERQKIPTHPADACDPAARTDGDASEFVFRPTGEEFCFNFRL